MTKDRFLFLLRDRLSALPQDELEERLDFYSEAIADRIEEGYTEEAAVQEMGPIDRIAADILQMQPVTKKRRMKAWELVLLILGSPVWLSLLIAALAVVFSVYISLWSVIVSLWAAFISAAVCVLGCLLAGVCFLCTGGYCSGVAMLASSMVCAGCSILLFFGSTGATKGVLWLTKRSALWLKLRFKKGEGA
ncbi:MAG: DUF1700 domain-containing protein [Oscillospiraceae bacterium]|nr:DUF1700 domain-containing protein [Oscillospiraceae bacterium]